MGFVHPQYHREFQAQSWPGALWLLEEPTIDKSRRLKASRFRVSRARGRGGVVCCFARVGRKLAIEILVAPTDKA